MQDDPSSPESDSREFVILAPFASDVPAVFDRKAVDCNTHTKLLANVQRLRGQIYSADGAISLGQLSPDGRHIQPADEKSWHLLVVGGNGAVLGALRYLPHPQDVTFEDLGVAHSALAKSDGQRLRMAVEAEISLARDRNIGYAEFGGWVLGPELRVSLAALQIILAGFALAEHLGSCLVISTATKRHGSASVLRRIGGRPLEWGGKELEPYFDPQYQCHMEILRFDTALPNSKFQPRVETLMEEILKIRVVCGAESAAEIATASRGIAA
jgi:hypothetical protein